MTSETGKILTWSASGESALSPFRRARLLKQIQERFASVPIQTVRAFYLYVAWLSEPLEPYENRRLRTLLKTDDTNDAADNILKTETGEQTSYWMILPRSGTITPWSTKATEIARRCGLDKIHRLERCIRYELSSEEEVEKTALAPLLYDRMTQEAWETLNDLTPLFIPPVHGPLCTIPVLVEGREALIRADREMGLALSEDEMDDLLNYFTAEQRDPTDVEIMMFAQVNSEHCRHKIFNINWCIDGEEREHTLFDMIRHSHLKTPQGTVLAYRDNAAIIAGGDALSFRPHPNSGLYGAKREKTHMLIKVETHNHPTAISPYPGAATGSGGEIRDEGATGRGGMPKAGLTGFSVSHLRIPTHLQPWELRDIGKPARIVSPLEIMLKGPIGAAAYNNEFGRPNLTGYFRTFEMRSGEGDRAIRGYHKPIMIAGGVGEISGQHLEKLLLSEGTLLFQIGGPAMLIGLGGGAASSQISGASSETLDFASVQRENPEMERRCQEVINRCRELGHDNPILSIHDVGAGGLSNAVPEIVHDGGGRGCRCDLARIPNDDPGMSPLEIWCNESQERYVLAIEPKNRDRFESICHRERCPFAEIGVVTRENRLTLMDTRSGRANQKVIDLDMDFLLGDPPGRVRNTVRKELPRSPFDTGQITMGEAVRRVLRFPAVADKTFLITIGDRTVGGRVYRDQMVGPWQVPVADAAVIATDFEGYTGEAVAMGERTPIALIDAPASGRLAVGEAITNIASAAIESLSNIKLSANWMAQVGHPGEDARLFDTVEAVALRLCPELGLSIPVGKDSLSMKTVWEKEGERHAVTAPLSLIVSAFAPVTDIRRTLTPQIQKEDGDPQELILIDLGVKKNRLGGSTLAQVFDAMGDNTPDLEDPQALIQFFKAIQDLNQNGYLRAYHDRSDGGLFVTLCEMAFAGRTGLNITLDGLGDNPLAILFSEELGAVIQTRRKDRNLILKRLACCGHVQSIGTLREEDERLQFFWREELCFESDRATLQRQWSEVSWRMQSLRDDPQCALEAHENIGSSQSSNSSNPSNPWDPGLTSHVTFEMAELKLNKIAPFLKVSRPEVAILREQGVNSQVEMAAAFDRAGFTAVDVTMSDLERGDLQLNRFQGLAVCGGFSFGDVLGAGRGWANTILFNTKLRDQFADFFERDDRLTLGVCNGCQMLSALRELIPGTAGWPYFVRNRSEQFESRLVLVEILPGPSPFFDGMAGSRLPIVCAHGEGRAVFRNDEEESVTSLRFVDHFGQKTEQYPLNPNGSPSGATGFTTPNGRVTILMPHPERLFRTVQHSWHPGNWDEEAPWLKFFQNARRWLG